MRKIELTKIASDCYIPSENNKNNIIFDSCVYDKRLLGNSEDIEKLLLAKNIGYAYFKTEVQEREIWGVPDRTLAYKEPWTPNPNAPRIMKILDELDVMRVSCYGHPVYFAYTILDGTYRVMDSENSLEPRVQMFYEIYNNNKRHLRDAIIAEACIYNHCKLVSIDTRLIGKVNKYYENTAFHFDDFIKKIQTDDLQRGENK